MAEQMTELISAMQEQQKQQMEQFAAILERLTVNNQPTNTTSVSVPRFDPYNREQEQWKQYLQRLNQHFTIYGVTDANQQRAGLLSWIGSESYELLTNLFGNEDITRKTFEDLTNKLTEHFKDKIHVQAARYEFYNRSMTSDQTYSDWAADLRGIARNCNFICKKDGCGESYVDDQIRDMIIKETPHADVRRQCLLEADPTLEFVLKKADTYVTTTETAKVLKGEVLQPTTNQMTASYNRHNYRGNTRKQSNAAPTLETTGSHKLKSCPQCFINHDRKQCPQRSKVCMRCKRTGHIQSVCRSTTHVITSSDSTNDDETIGSIYQVTNSGCNVSNHVYERVGKQIWINTVVNGVHTKFQWDTGATCSMVGLKGYQEIGSPACKPTTTTLHAYGHSALRVKGECQVNVQVGGIIKQNLRLFVVEANLGTNLMGLDWSDIFGLSQQGLSAVINKVEGNPLSLQHKEKEMRSDIQAISQQYPDIFQQGIGHCKSFKIAIHLKANKLPSFSRPRDIPYSRRAATKEELDRLEQAGVLEHIDFSEWAAPIVVVTKPSGKVRICGDFKKLNQSISVDQHPIPKLDDLMTKIGGGRYYTKLDLADAYLQLELDDESKKLCVINTPFGLYRYNRMCFGVASSPAQFQRCMDSLTAKLPGVAAYLDDLIVTGHTTEEHWANLHRLLKKLQDHGFRVRLEKCEFFKDSVEYLGHTIDRDGRRPAKSSLAALEQLPRPIDVHQLKAFLGKINYYGRFIANLADKAAPLYSLLKKEIPFTWSNNCEQAFDTLKNDVIRATNLVHYDESKPLILATDASSYGVGVVLSQVDKGREAPIAYASKTLTETQQKYSQIEREALSIIYGVTKFRQFLYGRRFTLVTDHEPLVSIFASDKNIPTLTAQRLQRWALILMGFQYDIKYKNTLQHGNADALSRLPIGPDRHFDSMQQLEDQEITHAIQEEIELLPIVADQVRILTKSDSTLQTVIEWINSGWPKTKPTEADLLTYWNRKEELFVSEGVLLLQGEKFTRVIIPKKLQTDVLSTLHSSHWGVVKMKQLARRYAWWSKINCDIEEMVKSCEICRQCSSMPSQTYNNWPIPQGAWERVHLDFAGPFRGKMWLLCIDAYSKFPYVGVMNIGQTTAKQTVQVLKDIFSLEGLPKTIVTDNGPQFIASDFEEFCNQYFIKHITSPAYHPASNGEAERYVQTFKKSVDKNCLEGMTLHDSVRVALASYRCLPHPSLDWKTPAEVLHGRQPRCLLSLLNPQGNNYQYSKQNTSTSQFMVDSLVYARNYNAGPKWLPGQIISKVGSTIYMVHTDKGVLKRHTNQLQIRLPSSSSEQHCNPAPSTAPPILSNLQSDNRRYPLRARRAPDRYVP